MTISGPQRALVSVGMPTARGGSHFFRALESVLTQDLENLEILIGDETGEAWPSVNSVADPRISYIRNGSRLGFARNHVSLLDRARGRYMAVLHDDDWWEPAYLSTLVKVLERDPEVGVSFCLAAMDRDHPSGDNVPCLPVPLSPGRHDHMLSVLLREEWFLLPSASVWRRDVWTGPAREWPQLRTGDLQLFLSAADAGWGFYHVPAPLAHWVQSIDQSTTPHGIDNGLSTAQDALAFWDGWLLGRPPQQVQLTSRQRAHWQLRLARALLLAGRSTEARSALASAMALAGPTLPRARLLSFATRIPHPVLRNVMQFKRAVWRP